MLRLPPCLRVALSLTCLPTMGFADDQSCSATSCGAPTLAREDVLLQLRHSGKVVKDVIGNIDALKDDISDLSGRRRRIQPFECSQHDGPVQVLLSRGGYDVRELDIESGTYKLLFQVPFSRTSPPYQRLNGCAVGPLDNITYCSMMIDEYGYVVRLDEQNVEFVAKMPWSYRAAFSERGTHHSYSSEVGQLFSFEDIHQLKGFSNHKHRQLPEGAAVAAVKEMEPMGADLVSVVADFEKTGSTEYLLSVGDGWVHVLRVDNSKTWKVSGPDGRDLPSGGFGAGWSYQGRVFFASNSGYGVYEVLLDTLNLEKGQVMTSLVGPSVVTHNNDGMNCMAAEAPPEWLPPCRPASTEVDFSKGQIVTNNLGGRGPDYGTEEIRIRGAVIDDRYKDVDMVVTSLGLYKPDSVRTNGRGAGDSFVSVNVDARQTVELNVRFESAQSKKAVELGMFEITFVDIDGDLHDERKESILVQGIDSYRVVDDHELSIEEGPGTARFTSTSYGGACDTPRDPRRLRKVTCGGQTVDQRKRSALVMFSNTSSFNVSFAVGKGCKGRSFLFAGASSLNQVCSTTTTTTTPTTRTMTTTTTLAPEIGLCVVWGDPHINVFDNFRLQRAGRGSDLLMADHGDFWLVKHSQIHIQGRYWSSNLEGASSMRALAISGPFLDDHTFLIQAMDGRVLWDGKEVLSEFPSQFSIDKLIEANTSGGGHRIDANLDHLALHTVYVQLPRGVKVTINRWPTHIDAMISMTRPRGPIDGHCGNWNGDSADDTAADIKKRMGGQVPVEEDLFTRKSFEYVGCFKDDIGDRDLVQRKGAQMKRGECALACGDYAYFSQQWEGECFCGTSYGKHGELPASACDCDAENVGGDRNCVYRYEGEPLLPVTPAIVEKRLEDVDPQVRSRATKLCQDAVSAVGGELTEDFMDCCVYDVCFGDESFAETAAFMQKQTMIRAEEIEEELRLVVSRSESTDNQQRRELRDGEAHPNMDFTMPDGQGQIRWATNPEFCWGLESGRDEARRTSRLHLASCDDTSGGRSSGLEFVAPASGEGMIRLAADPTLCLDVPGGHHQKGTRLQLWKCEENHPNMVFTMPPAGGSGRIQWTARPEICLDVSGGRQAVGAHIQLWKCEG